MMDANAINEIINDRESISRRNWDEKSSMINPIKISPVLVTSKGIVARTL